MSIYLQWLSKIGIIHAIPRLLPCLLHAQHYLHCLRNNNIKHITWFLTQYFAGGKIEKNSMGGNVARMGERSGVCRGLVGKPERKRPLGRSRCRWEDNIKMDLQEMGGGCGDWMEMAQDRDRWRALVNAEMTLRVP